LIPAGDPEALALDLVAEARSLIAVLHLPLIAALVQTLTGEVVAAPTGALFAVEGSNQSDERPVLKWWL
jgi:phosphohistidine phosphatase SixA